MEDKKTEKFIKGIPSKQYQKEYQKKYRESNKETRRHKARENYQKIKLLKKEELEK